MSCIGALCGDGGYDYAGGGPVHISSGFAGLAYSIAMNHAASNKEIGEEVQKKNSLRHSSVHMVQSRVNITNVFLGTAMLWFGWFGFNGGSSLNATPRGVVAGLNTTLAASMSGLTWVLLDGKWSSTAFCSGVVTGLVVITPGSGFVTPWASLVFGFVGVAFVFGVIKVKKYLMYDDTLDTFAVHGMGGFVGNILTGIFA